MSEQLDWLARNVHEWPLKQGDALFVGRDHRCSGFNAKEADTGFYPDTVKRVTYQQWLDRRAELQGKPSWEDHPDAKCFVQTECGAWFKSAGHISMSRRVGSQATLRIDTPLEFVCNGEVIGDWRDTLERRQLSLGVSDSDALRPLSRADALRWAVENVKTWPAEEPDSAPSGWEWQQCSGMMYLQRNGDALISMLEWAAGVAKLQSCFEPLTSMEDSKPATLHTIHHAAFLHRDCQLLLNEPELVAFRTADGELLHCKPKECLIDPDTYGLAARLLSDMSGCNVAPEHIRELVEQMGWSI